MATSRSSSSRSSSGRSSAPKGNSPLITSPAKAQREKAVLKRGRAQLASRKTSDDTSARSSVTGRELTDSP